MSEKDKKILETIAKALPNMTEFDKGYFLGTAESKASEKKHDNTHAEEAQQQETN